MIHIYVTGVIEDKNTNPKQDETVWESDETYIQWENEFEIPILKKEAEQEEEKNVRDCLQKIKLNSLRICLDSIYLKMLKRKMLKMRKLNQKMLKILSMRRHI